MPYLLFRAHHLHSKTYIYRHTLFGLHYYTNEASNSNQSIPMIKKKKLIDISKSMIHTPAYI